MDAVVIDPAVMLQVAELMTRIKPDWWPRVEDALEQLRAETRGWYLARPDGSIAGFLACILLAGYRAVEIDVLGYDDSGTLNVGQPLGLLVAACQDWAFSMGAAYVRFIVGSRGLSIHGRPLGPAWQELRDLDTSARPDVAWFRSIGYEPSGLLPNTYGQGYHGVLLIKRLAS